MRVFNMARKNGRKHGLKKSKSKLIPLLAGAQAHQYKLTDVTLLLSSVTHQEPVAFFFFFFKRAK